MTDLSSALAHATRRGGTVEIRTGEVTAVTGTEFTVMINGTEMVMIPRVVGFLLAAGDIVLVASVRSAGVAQYFIIGRVCNGTVSDRLELNATEALVLWCDQDAEIGADGVLNLWSNTTVDMTAVVQLPTASPVITDLGAAVNGKITQNVWTAYTPTWTASSVNPAIGNGTITGKYLQTGKLVHAVAQVTMGSTTTYGTGYYWLTLPAALPSTGIIDLGTLLIYDSSAATFYTGVSMMVDTAKFRMNQGTGLVSGVFPITLATSDRINVTMTYETSA